MFLVGLTGGIATGKSTVSRMLAEMGCPVVDADVIAREVVEPGKPAWRKIKEIFGKEFLLVDGTLNRDKLGHVIFSDPDKRRLLNSITHPEIYKAMIWRVLGYCLSGWPYVILDLPLLFETGAMTKYLNRTIVVTCDADVQLKRLMIRNGYTNDDALQRIHAQLPLVEKCKRADHVIQNTGTLEDTKFQVKNIYTSLQRNKSHWKLRLVILGIVVVSSYGIFKLFGFV